jgi:uncharacterized membrane protein YgcG
MRRGITHRVLTAIGIAVLAIVFTGAAATPGDVAATAREDGFFIESGSGATPEVVGRSVADARGAGSLMYVVVLADEPPSGATTFADGTLDRLPRAEGTVLVVAPETVGWASNNDIWTPSQLDEASDRSLDGSTDDEIVTIFVDTLVDPPSAGSSGLWILLIVIAVIVVVVVLLVVRGNRARRQKDADALEGLRRSAQAQIDALANDILDAEDEVATSDDALVKGHFDAAAETYAGASERLAVAASPSAVLAIASELDLGIWHLDCAEAILDGVALPPEPKPPSTRPAPEPKATVDRRPSVSEEGSSVPPLPEYQRRSSRRSGFGADDMLKTVVAMQAMRSLGRRSSPRSGGSSSRSGGGSRPPSSGRSRGGGRRRG